jgi:hypothetical protein
LAAEAALSRGHELQVVLPLPRGEYAGDFADPESVAAFRRLLSQATAVFELPGDGERAGSRDTAYEAVGLFTLRQSDLLLAVWDGGEARGRGGTANVVARAVQSGIPVAWLDPEGNRAPRLLWVGGDQAMPAQLDLGAIPQEDLAAQLPDVVRSLVAHPQAGTGSRDRLDRFFREKPPRWNLRVAYPLLLGIAAVRRPVWSDVRRSFDGKAARAGWHAYWRKLPEIGGFAAAPLASVLLHRCFWADSLATHYAQTFRSGYVANFLLSAAAVAMALMGLIAHQLKPLWVAVELTLIALILVNTLFGISRRWHDRWLDYRHLAEALRHLRYLAFSGSAVRSARAQHDQETEDSWIEWYVAATQRELGLPTASADESYVEAVRRILREVELAQQTAYHRQNVQRLERLHHRLHIAGLVAFGGTALACIGFLAIFLRDYLLCHHLAEASAPWATFLTALLPAIGAALYGIRVQGDFEGVAHRSKAMAARLEEIDRLLQHDPPTFAMLSRIAEQTSDTMLAEVADWRLVFRTRPLDLPA